MEIPANAKWSKPETPVTAKPSAQLKSNGEKVLMTFVQDGDTASGIRADGSTLNCRIDNIEAPEVANPKYGKNTAQPYSGESKRSLEDLVKNKEVTVRVVRASDKFGRSICQIEVEGKNIGREQIRQGAAWAYREFGGQALDPLAQDAENTAKKVRKGLFADPNATYPRDFKQIPQ